MKIEKMPHARRGFIVGAVLFGGLIAGGVSRAALAKKPAAARFPVTKTNAEWKAQLTADQYYILREHGTERAFTSPLDREKRKGTFTCAGCKLPLFSSTTKYDSRTGWPSFWKPLPSAVGTTTDYKIGFPRTEVHCARCGGHLGHVFNDGPKPTGLRYCMNGDAMRFIPAA